LQSQLTSNLKRWNKHFSYILPFFLVNFTVLEQNRLIDLNQSSYCMCRSSTSRHVVKQYCRHLNTIKKQGYPIAPQQALRDNAFATNLSKSHKFFVYLRK